MLLYLHIPFCDSKCFYCAFNSYTNLHHLQNRYMSAICKQFEKEVDRSKITLNSIETLFIGGGTPSCINPKLYKPFFNLVKPYLQKEIEITSEANPNSATIKWLEGMRELGVNRISFGVQSFNEKKLKFLNRSHSKKEALKAIESAKKVGFNHISIDLIYGTKLDDKKLLISDLDTAFLLPIDHLSAYSLTIEKGTKFYKTPNVSKDDEDLAYWLVDKINQRGFKQYEISNFGEYQSKHNLGYWQYKDYLGIGSGAVGFLKDSRYYTNSDPERYILEPLYRTYEKLSQDDIICEKILLGFRSMIGVKRDILNATQIKRAEILCNEDKLILKDEIFYNPNYFLADELALYLLS